MIYRELLLGFLKIGLFSFGGAYGAIPLIRDTVLSFGWMSADDVAYWIAVSESTPGPIMVNLATHVGYTAGGFPGALLATSAVVLPSFLVILLFILLSKRIAGHPAAGRAVGGITPCMIGIIIATGLCMCFSCVMPDGLHGADIRALIVTVVIAAVMAAAHLMKKRVSPIAVILIGAALGAVAYGI